MATNTIDFINIYMFLKLKNNTSLDVDLIPIVEFKAHSIKRKV